MTATTTIKEVISNHYREIWNAGNLEEILAKLDKTVAANYLDHNPVPGQAPGIAGLKQVVANLHTAFPDLQTEVLVLIAEGDMVCGHWLMRATNTGPLAFMGLPPTGKPVQMSGTDLMRVKDGKIVEWWHQEEVLGMMAQLGFGPGQH